MQGILDRQNEPRMLEIQFSARHFFNRAEKVSILTTYLAFIPLLALLPFPDDWLNIVNLVALAIDATVIFLIARTHKLVNQGATLRAYFDSYVLQVKTDSYDKVFIKSIDTTVYNIMQKYAKKATLESQNDGSGVLPGVKNWYEPQNATSHNDAVRQCQVLNKDWDKDLNKYRIIRLTVFAIILIAIEVLLIFIFKVTWYNILFATGQLVLRLVERIVAYIKFIAQSLAIDSLAEALEADPSKSNQKVFQRAIDKRRRIPVLGSKSGHKKNAKKLSDKYKAVMK